MCRVYYVTSPYYLYRVIYLLDTQFEDDKQSSNMKMLIKMVILILGLSPATRNTIRMMLGI
jgi:uncharacterized membrane protein